MTPAVELGLDSWVGRGSFVLLSQYAHYSLQVTHREKSVDPKSF